MSTRNVLAASTIAMALIVGIGYLAATAWAAGAPTTDPLVFTGTLLDNGAPVADASHSVRLAFYDVETGGISLDQNAGSIPVRNGRFRVVISNTEILQLIRDTPDVWVEVIVDSTPLGRTKIGAVPYALEADRAAGASGALEADLVEITRVLSPVATDEVNGFVGIGTTSPTSELDVVGDIAVSGTVDGVDLAQLGSTVATHVGNAAIHFPTSATMTGLIRSTGSGNSYFTGGNLGIGTTTPSENLSIGPDLGGYTGNRISIGGSSNDGLMIGEDADYFGWVLWRAANDLLSLGTRVAGVNYSDTLVLDSGNVGIGVTSPLDRLHVAGRIRANELLLRGTVPDILAGNGTDVATFLDINFPDVSTSTAYVRIFRATNTTGTRQVVIHRGDGTSAVQTRFDADGNTVLNALAGNVGIGTTSPSYKVDVNGQVRADNVSVTSDARFKRDIEPIEDAVSRVMKMRGVTYAWKDGARGRGRQVGVIAQEVESVVPEVVSTDRDGMKSVSYNKLVPVLLEAIKEQQSMLASQRARIDALEKRLSGLSATGTRHTR